MRRVYLHIGLHKTGTTFLQSLLKANRERLAEQGVLYPGGQGRERDSGPHVVQAHAVWDLFGRRPRGSRDARIAGQWEALCAQVAASALPTALVSVEYLSLATPAQARRAVESFGDAEVHVVVTARDLGRVLVSAWQEEVKNGRTWTWDEFISAVRDPEARARNPARGFWLRQDLPAVLDTWRPVLRSGRVHVVVVPPGGSGSHELVARFATTVGVDATRLSQQVSWTNETVGAAGVEVVRRLNERLGTRLNQRQYDKVVRQQVSAALQRSEGRERLRLPAEHEEWAAAESQRVIDHVAAGDYDVVGRLDDLHPTTADTGRLPGEASADELLEASLDALSSLAESHAALWWEHRRPDVTTGSGPSVSRVSSTARGAVFRGKRRGAELADRNRLAGLAMRLYLRTQARARARRAAGSS